MAKGDAGLWSVTIGPIQPELYGYFFDVDGVTVLDPSNPQVKQHLSRNMSALLVPGKESDLYAVKGVPHGTLSIVWYPSPTLGMARRMSVYTPPGYEDSATAKYPVLYLLHGAGGNEEARPQLGVAPAILDNLMSQGQATPMVVVMPNGEAEQAGKRGETPPAVRRDSPPGDRRASSARFEESLIKDIIPYIEMHYRVLADKNHRAMAGYSMGGAQTQQIALSNPTLFAYIGVFGAGVRRPSEDLETQYADLKSKNPKLYWVGVGQEDTEFRGVQTLVALLKKNQFYYTYREIAWGHNFASWRIYFSELAPLLFK